MTLPLITLEIVLGFGVPVAWGVWQLIELRRLKRRDQELEARALEEAGFGGAPESDRPSPRGPDP